MSAATFCALLATGASAAASAQARLPDPTRPPDAAAAQKPGEAKPAAPSHRLQSVLISKQRRLAVIDGRTVPLGGEVDGGRVVAIDEGSVTLRRGGQSETLRLNPGVDKKVVEQ